MAKKKFFTKEVKIGIAFIVAAALLFFGLNFLKGINIFTPTNHYQLQYENIDGLVVSNGVFIKGYKIGQVREIKYDFTQEKPFTVDIMINKDIKLPLSTTAYLFDESILGGKGINLVWKQDNGQYHNSGDALNCDVELGLLASLSDIVPALKATVAHIDSLIVAANEIIGGDELKNSLKNIETITNELNSTSKSLRVMMETQLPPMLDNANNAITNINEVADSIKTIDFSELGVKLDSVMQNIEQLSQKINDPNGTLGKVLNDPALYNDLNTTINSANELLIDIKANPKRYINVTIFGGKEKKEKTK